MKKVVSLFVLLSLATMSASALPPPEKDEMTIGELACQLFNLDGKVIETEITNVYSFEQIAPGKYSAGCMYYKGTSVSSSTESVLIPEDGREFFEEMAEKDILNHSSETVFLLVHCTKPIEVKGVRYNPTFTLEAIGTRFKKSKGVYTW